MDHRPRPIHRAGTLSANHDDGRRRGMNGVNSSGKHNPPFGASRIVRLFGGEN
jgi:hypothetical protein